MLCSYCVDITGDTPEVRQAVFFNIPASFTLRERRTHERPVCKREMAAVCN